jgi:hypothetical protein
MTAAIAETERFARDVAPHLGRLFGMDLNIRITELDMEAGAGMAADPATGDVLLDPRFFHKDKQTTPDQASYGIMHETVAHIKRITNSPKLAETVERFITDPRTGQVDKARHIFDNILEDVDGNRSIHAMLPRMERVGKDMYENRLFKETDYQASPRHLQFLYKILRTAMVPDQEVTVLPEVDEALASLRDFQGQGDVIDYSTAPSVSATERLSDEQRFTIWRRVIYPVYEALLEQDRQDPNMQDQQQSESGEGQEGQSGESNQDSQQQPGESSSGQQSGQPSSGKPSDNERFGSHYDDYEQHRHQNPMHDHDHDVLHDHAKQEQQATSQSPNQAKRQRERRLDERVKAETGHSLHEKRQYDAEIERWRGVIDEMRGVYASIITDRIAEKRVLSRKPQIEGAVLHPDRLAQTIIDLRSDIGQPEAFRDYQRERAPGQSIGETDYIFLLDVSGSMQQDGKSEAAATSTVIVLEGLAALQRDVEAAERETGLDLELDIRTAIYAFGEESTCLKPLSKTLSNKERLDSYAAVSQPDDGYTRDYLALEEVLQLLQDKDRRQIVIAVSDGGSNGAPDARSRARSAIEQLRKNGAYAYGISIGSDEAEQLYRPTAKMLEDPSKLPETIASFLEATIR